MSAEADALRAQIADLVRERDEAQARTERVERRLSHVTTALLVVVCVIALTAVGIFLTPDQVAGLLAGAR